MWAARDLHRELVLAMFSQYPALTTDGINKCNLRELLSKDVDLGSRAIYKDVRMLAYIKSCQTVTIDETRGTDMNPRNSV